MTAHACDDDAPDSTPRRPGRPKNQALRASILAATDALLRERGLKALTMEAIAERAGASKVTIYRCWPNKMALAIDAFLAAVARDASFGNSASALHDLHENILALARLLDRDDGGRLIELVAEGVHDPEVAEAMRTRWVAPRRVTAMKIVRRGMASGEIRPEIDPEVVLDALYGPVYFRLIVTGMPIDRAFVESLWASVLGGIAA